MDIKTFTKGELNEILRKHALWLNNDPNGSRANLRRADLRGADLRGAYLREADLRGANLSRSDLRRADLRGVNLREADLRGADLREADLRGAILSRANLSRVKNLICPITCPEEGSFIGFKKVRKNCIVKLEIPEDALRCSSTGRKCRCSKAKVLSITNIDGTEANVIEVFSKYDPSFVYRVGEIVSVDNFDTNRWNECAPGIHFFITRQEAVDY